LPQRKHWNPERESFPLEDSYWLLLKTIYTIGSMSVDQNKQIGIRRAERSFQLIGSSIQQKNFEKPQEKKGR
jgi:hypothetical protein